MWLTEQALEWDLAFYTDEVRDPPIPPPQGLLVARVTQPEMADVIITSSPDAYPAHLRPRMLHPTNASLIYDMHQPARRRQGQRQIPLHLWNHPTFQHWRESCPHQILSGTPLWTFPDTLEPFCAAIQLSIWIEEEQRSKDNEFILLRPDSVAVILYHHPDTWVPTSLQHILQTQIVLVKEHRINSRCGYVLELPSGTGSTLQDALTEVYEETRIHLTDLQYITFRQNFPTMLAHGTHLFAAHVSKDILDQIPSQSGDLHAGEITYPMVLTLEQALQHHALDWSALGYLLQKFLGPHT
jgi:hypothetical protein